MRTFINGREDARSGATTVQNGDIRWVAWYYALPFAFYDTYGSTNVTCANGKVAAFSGLVSTTTKVGRPVCGGGRPVHRHAHGIATRTALA